MKDRNRIGFDYAGRDNRVAENKEISKSETQEILERVLKGELQPKISQAHMGLVQKINGIANIIAEPTFSSLPKEQKDSYIQALIESVALETELSTKNMMLGGGR